MKWNMVENSIELYPAKPFSFSECLLFLNRSNLENLHRVIDGVLYKLLNIGEKNVLIKITESPSSLVIDFPMGECPSDTGEKVIQFVEEWLGLNQDMAGFYTMAAHDPLLSPLIDKYTGLRIIGIPDLFEALVWAVIGQQINLTFAYTLKKRLVELCGERVEVEGLQHWTFPSYEKVANLTVEDFRNMQFTGRKAETILHIARMMHRGELLKESLLLENDVQAIHHQLTSIKGVGPWTAEYVMMKSLQLPNAFPVSDVGLHNAIKDRMNLPKKPTVNEIKEMAEVWEGWKAYATFYLWRSLYDETAL